LSEYFDELDTQEPAIRTRAQFAKLAQHLQSAVQTCPGLAEHLSGHDLSAIQDEQSLQLLPVLRKSALMQAQAGKLRERCMRQVFVVVIVYTIRSHITSLPAALYSMKGRGHWAAVFSHQVPVRQSSKYKPCKPSQHPLLLVRQTIY